MLFLGCQLPLSSTFRWENICKDEWNWFLLCTPSSQEAHPFLAVRIQIGQCDAWECALVKASQLWLRVQNYTTLVTGASPLQIILIPYKLLWNDNADLSPGTKLGHQYLYQNEGVHFSILQSCSEPIKLQLDRCPSSTKASQSNLGLEMASWVFVSYLEWFRSNSGIFADSTSFCGWLGSRPHHSSSQALGQASVTTEMESEVSDLNWLWKRTLEWWWTMDE